MVSGGNLKDFADKHSVALLYVTIVLAVILIIILFALLFKMGNYLMIHPRNIGCTGAALMGTGPTGYPYGFACKNN